MFSRARRNCCWVATACVFPPCCPYRWSTLGSVSLSIGSDWELQNLKHWSLGEVLLQLGWIVPNYFSCSLVAMPCPESGRLDMPAFFERQRRVIFSATIALSVMG